MQSEEVTRMNEKRDHLLKVTIMEEKKDSDLLNGVDDVHLWYWDFRSCRTASALKGMGPLSLYNNHLVEEMLLWSKNNSDSGIKLKKLSLVYLSKIFGVIKKHHTKDLKESLKEYRIACIFNAIQDKHDWYKKFRLTKVAESAKRMDIETSANSHNIEDMLLWIENTYNDDTVEGMQKLDLIYLAKVFNVIKEHYDKELSDQTKSIGTLLAEDKRNRYVPTKRVSL